MKSPLVAAAAAATLLLAGQAGAQEADARAQFLDRDGRQVGSADLIQTPNGVLVIAEVRGLPEGRRGFHIHETGRCDPQDGFESAGGHFAFGDQTHGYMTEGGPHAGDMPNQSVGSDGRLVAEAFNPRVSLREGEDGYLLDSDGSSIVVHAGADDYSSQPSGDAGDRLACAVIERR